MHRESQIFFNELKKTNMFIVVIDGKGYWKLAKMQNPSQTECYTSENYK